jgi:hypothetical protein
MSYDLHIYRKDTQGPRLTKEELAKLDSAFEVTITSLDESGMVIGFDLKGKRGEVYEFFQQDDGSYWSSVSYSATPDEMKLFRQTIKDVATRLELVIRDPQISEDHVDPANFQPENPESIKRFATTKNVTQQVPYMLPADEKYFILYFIYSRDSSQKERFLVFGENSQHASKVNPGESLSQVVSREIRDITGSPTFTFMNVQHNYDTALDRFGKSLSRSAVYIDVPFFDPKTVKTKYPVHWIEIPGHNVKESQQQEEEIFAIKDHDVGELRAYWQKYTDAKPSLDIAYPNSHIATLNVFIDKNNKRLTSTSWANFISAVLPESDYVTLSIFDFDETQMKATGPLTLYAIEQQKLFSLLGDHVKKILDPVLCFVMKSIQDTSLREEIIKQSKFVGRK